MKGLFSRITKGKEDALLFEEGVLCESGRLSQEGRELLIDLLFSGMTVQEARKKIIEEIEEDRKEKK